MGNSYGYGSYGYYGGGYYGSSQSSETSKGISRLRGSTMRLEDSGCAFMCPTGSGMFSIDMFDQYGDGWGGG